MATNNDRANLESLPNELRSKIYHHIFSGSRVRLHTRGRCEADLSEPHKFGNTYLALRLVCKAFRYDAILYRTFLQSSTIVISEDDLERLESCLGRGGLELIRYICVRCQNGRWRVAATKGTDRPDSFTLSSILKVIPNLRSVSTVLDGPHINTFQHDLGYTLAMLIAVADRIIYGLKETKALVVVKSDVAHRLSDGRMSYVELRYSYPDDDIISVRKTGTYDCVPFSEALTDLKNFQYTMATCLKRTAAKYDPRWYYNFLYEAHEHNIEVLFDVDLMFLSDMRTEYTLPVEDRYHTIENIPASSKDWMLRLEANGGCYKFPQLPPAGTWKDWIMSQLDLYGGPLNQTPAEGFVPTPKRQKMTRHC